MSFMNLTLDSNIQNMNKRNQTDDANVKRSKEDVISKTLKEDIPKDENSILSKTDSDYSIPSLIKLKRKHFEDTVYGSHSIWGLENGLGTTLTIREGPIPEGFLPVPDIDPATDYLNPICPADVLVAKSKNSQIVYTKAEDRCLRDYMKMLNAKTDLRKTQSCENILNSYERLQHKNLRSQIDNEIVDRQLDNLREYKYTVEETSMYTIDGCRETEQECREATSNLNEAEYILYSMKYKVKPTRRNATKSIEDGYNYKEESLITKDHVTLKSRLPVPISSSKDYPIMSNNKTSQEQKVKESKLPEIKRALTTFKDLAKRQISNNDTNEPYNQTSSKLSPIRSATLPQLGIRPSKKKKYSNVVRNHVEYSVAPTNIKQIEQAFVSTYSVHKEKACVPRGSITGWINKKIGQTKQIKNTAQTAVQTPFVNHEKTAKTKAPSRVRLPVIKPGKTNLTKSDIQSLKIAEKKKIKTRSKPVIDGNGNRLATKEEFKLPSIDQTTTSVVAKKDSYQRNGFKLKPLNPSDVVVPHNSKTFLPCRPSAAKGQRANHFPHGSNNNISSIEELGKSTSNTENASISNKGCALKEKIQIKKVKTVQPNLSYPHLHTIKPKNNSLDKSTKAACKDIVKQKKNVPSTKEIANIRPTPKEALVEKFKLKPLNPCDSGTCKTFMPCRPNAAKGARTKHFIRKASTINFNSIDALDYSSRDNSRCSMASDDESWIYTPYKNNSALSDIELTSADFRDFLSASEYSESEHAPKKPGEETYLDESFESDTSIHVDNFPTADHDNGDSAYDVIDIEMLQKWLPTLV